MNDSPTDPLDATDWTWLAGLARALLGEAHAADDLVQDTVVAAMAGPLPDGAPRRAWLAGVARRLAKRRQRGEGRRRRREQAAARPEALPDSAELVARAELAEQVTAATRRLPEPYRRTLLLRFLEGCSAEDLARREGTPPDTVRWRVRRGLELLRAELVRGSGTSWSSWCVLIAPLARLRGDVGVATAGTSGVLMTSLATWTTMKLMTAGSLSLGGLVLGGAGLWLVWSGPPDVESKERRPTPPPIAQRPAEELVPGDEALAVQRAEVANAASPASAPSNAPPAPIPDTALATTLFGQVVDEAGDPVPGATVYLVPGTRAADPRAEVAVLTRQQTDAGGQFWMQEVELLTPSPLDLGVVAQGYLRTMVQDVQRQQPSEGLTVVLRRGRSLRGRVVDEYGLGIPDLDLLASTRGGGIEHVSPTQVLLRAEREWLGDGRSTYQQCRARTDASGMVEFSGLPDDDFGLRPLELRSLDPGWALVDSALGESALVESALGESNPSADTGGLRIWTAARRLGVRLLVEDTRGTLVPRASAVFRVRLRFADGASEDYGQWVGRGEGRVSFQLNEEVLPPLKGRVVTRAAFYGTASVDGVEQAWEAPVLQDPRGAGGLATVQLRFDPPPLAETALGPAPPTAEIELEVRDARGRPYEGRLEVSWTSRPDQGPVRTGSGAISLAPGLYRVEPVAGEVVLEVTQGSASGSLPAWSERLRCEADQTITRSVDLPGGASVSLRRPLDWTGEWFVQASWRANAQQDWRGRWTYSTRAERLELSALKPAEWRFTLRRSSEDDAESVELRATLGEGDRTHLGD